MFLLVHCEVQDILSQPENFRETLLISGRFPGFPGGKNYSSRFPRFPGFPGVLDTLYKCKENERTYWGLWEIHGLEDETHDGSHLYHFSAHQTQLLVVVKHRVHVLYPHGVDWTVENHPLPVRRVGHCKLTECVRRNSVRPLHIITTWRHHQYKQGFI